MRYARFAPDSLAIFAGASATAAPSVALGYDLLKKAGFAIWSQIAVELPASGIRGVAMGRRYGR
jgi:hypothetical protein